MALKLNLLFVAALLLLATSALADDDFAPVEPPTESQVEPPTEVPPAEGPAEYNYYAERDICLKMMGNMGCTEEIAYVLIPDIVLGFVPPPPSKRCCQNVMKIDSMVPECWNRLVEPQYMFLKNDLLEYCATELGL